MFQPTAWTRREFLQFLGVSAAQIALSGCASIVKPLTDLPVPRLAPNDTDAVVLTEGFEYQIMIRAGEVINTKGEKFGYNNDYIAMLPADKPNEFLMWVNNESVTPSIVSNWKKGVQKTKAQVQNEMSMVGGSILRVKKTEKGYEWIKNSPNNRRVSGLTPIPLVSERPIEGKKVAIGTLGNCAGGVTPWGTVLTCEENYHELYGENTYDEKNEKKYKEADGKYSWTDHVKNPPEHYGWVVEVELKTGKAKKLTALGRFAHEGATCVKVDDGRTVVYMGDDKADQCIYKFISAKKGSLEKGDLYVANTVSGNWLKLDLSNPTLAGKFKDKTEMLIRTRDAAKFAGGTPLARPEDIEIHPATKAVYITLTNDTKKENYFGEILKIEEENGDHLSMKFKASTFLTGGESSGLACPDNLAFDRKGNLWVTSDMAGFAMHLKPYTKFKNNGLFYIPMSGPAAGEVIQVASAPRDAEFTGPYFSPDGMTLFLSVQHPGEETVDTSAPTSSWPDGGNSLPSPAVIAVSGPALQKLLA